VKGLTPNRKARMTQSYAIYCFLKCGEGKGLESSDYAVEHFPPELVELWLYDNNLLDSIYFIELSHLFWEIVILSAFFFYMCLGQQRVQLLSEWLTFWLHFIREGRHSPKDTMYLYIQHTSLLTLLHHLQFDELSLVDDNSRMIGF
jgi:hypothetical protein